MNNPDLYTMVGECPTCKAQRDLHASKNQILSGELIEVYSGTCDHHSTLTKEQNDKVRKHLQEISM